MVSSRMGYEYRYCFSVDDEMVSRYGGWYRQTETRLVFETRTKFIVKSKFDDAGGADEQVLDSETYDVGALESDRDEAHLEVWLGSRLRDYWMSDDEIREFLRQALAFAAMADDGRHGMIPIAVDIDVCTVQQEGEPIDAAVDRAIRPDCLYPMYLCPWIESSRPQTEEYYGFRLLFFLRHKLCAIRVEDVDEGLSLMEECPICLCNPIVGSQISSLGCGHIFHYHCIARWLADDDSCPMCRQQAHDEFSR